MNEAQKKLWDNIDVHLWRFEEIHNLTVGQTQLAKLNFIGPKRIISFMHEGVIPVSFYVPKAYLDFIQGFQLLNETFWDRTALDAISPLVRDKHVLDIGANVGNHTIYMAKVAGARSIQAFEPLPETFGILTKNVAINKLTKTVKVHAIALGEFSEVANITSPQSNRMQAKITKGGAGSVAIQVRALDSLNVSAVDFMKIDVEGHTLALLKGAVKTMARFKPVMYVELWNAELESCGTFLNDLGYKPIGGLGVEGNYLFVHRDNAKDEDMVKAATTAGWPLAE